VPVTLPFRLPFRTGGRERVVSTEERDIVRRWAGGKESYDPATGAWAPARISKFERHRRRMVDRAMEIGLPTGTRPAAWKAWPGGHTPDSATSTLRPGRCTASRRAPR
jgi:hypothetical protein